MALGAWKQVPGCHPIFFFWHAKNAFILHSAAFLMHSPHLIDFFSDTTSLEKSDSVLLSSDLSVEETHILHVVHSRWPTSSLEIAEFLGQSVSSRDEKRLVSSRLAYHIKKLVSKRKLMSKRFGNALIVWPYEVETLRVMKDVPLVKGDR